MSVHEPNCFMGPLSACWVPFTSFGKFASLVGAVSLEYLPALPAAVFFVSSRKTADYAMAFLRMYSMT